LVECDVELEAYLRTFADRTDGRPLEPRPGGRGRRRRANDPAFEGVREALYRMSGADLTVLEGVDENTALVILSEVGPDVSRFPTVKQFTSWLGLCPQHRGSAGKIRSRRVRRGANRVARALRLAVQGCHHAKNTLGAFYRRIQARAGAPKAIVATARKLAERVYRLLRYGEAYVRQDVEAYEAAYRSRVVKGLARQAGELGYRLEPMAAAAS
jgi:transposase